MQTLSRTLGFATCLVSSNAVHVLRRASLRDMVAGDLLRAEQHRPGSQYGEMIRTYIKEGLVVPMEVTIKLLENAMREALSEGRTAEGWEEGRGRFLIDGFPRKMDQALKFDEDVRAPRDRGTAFGADVRCDRGRCATRRSRCSSRPRKRRC